MPIALEWIDGARSRRLELGGGSVSIGRDPASNVVLNSGQASWNHARLEGQSGQVVLFDLNSKNGTFLNGQRLTAPSEIREGDRIQIADVAFNVTKPQQAAAVQTGQARFVIGRDSSCDIFVDDPMASRQHAVLDLGSGRWILSDRSKNGTFVNGRRMPSSIEVHAGDRITIGSQTVTLTPELLRAGGSAHKQPASGEAAITVENLSLVVNADGAPKTLLDDVSLSIGRGELVAIVGESGAGKTTTLLTMAGFKKPSHGNVYIDGLDAYQFSDAIQGRIGYVPQEDILHRELPLRQALQYAAKLRLPSDVGEDEISAIVSQTLGSLGLYKQAETEVKRLSGGERKRANMAVELLTKPSLLFLDEWDSGLDSAIIREITQLLHDLVSEGRTIVTITHRLEAIDHYDRFIVMQKGGRLTFSGPPSEAKAFFNVEDLSYVYEQIRDKDQHYATRFKQSYRPGFSNVPGIVPARKGLSAGEFFSETGTLINRSINLIFRDTRNFAILALQAPIMAAIICIIFKSDIMSRPARIEGGRYTIEDLPILMFLITTCVISFGLFNAAREIVKEQAIFKRESHAGLRLSTYVASKIFVLGGIAALQACILLTLVSLKLPFGLSGADSIWFAAIFALGGLDGVLIGLAISARSNSSEEAVTVSVLVLLFCIVFAGLLPLEKLGPLKSVASITPSRWTYGGALNLLQMPARFTEVPPLAGRVNDIFRTNPILAAGVLLATGTVAALITFWTMARRSSET